MAPDFEIFRKIEIMRMISFFLPDLRLSAIGTPELRIAAPDVWRMTLTQKSRMCTAPGLRITNPCARFRCIFEEDYIHTNSRRIKFGWRKANPSQKQGDRPYIHVMVRLIQWHSEVKLSLDVFQTYSSKNVIPYSACMCPILITKLALSQ